MKANVPNQRSNSNSFQRVGSVRVISFTLRMVKSRRKPLKLFEFFLLRILKAITFLSLVTSSTLNMT